MIDLAVPRDLDPTIAQLEDVYLYTLDDLRAVIADNLKARGAAAAQAETLVEDYAKDFERWLERPRCRRHHPPTARAGAGQP